MLSYHFYSTVSKFSFLFSLHLAQLLDTSHYDKSEVLPGFKRSIFHTVAF